MGACCSQDSLPPVPPVILPAPSPGEKEVNFVVARLGRFWGRDYGVWKDKLGSNESLWFWVNKSDGPKSGTGVIDMENFDRDEKTKKGKVFWTSMINEQPNFDQFQRAAILPNGPGQTHGPLRFKGIHPTDGYSSESDEHYVRQLPKKESCMGKGEHTGQDTGEKVSDLGWPVISKWRLNTAAYIKDGNLGRGLTMMIPQGETLMLEVFSKGSGATTWQQVESWREVPDGTPPDGQPQKYRIQYDKSVKKEEKEWIDRIEFRLSFRGQVVGRPWVVKGDAGGGQGDTVIENDFFHACIKGGMFTKTASETTTKASGIDPILSLLLSHLCVTEFSVAEIKNDLKLQTPSVPPAATHPHRVPTNLDYAPRSNVQPDSCYKWM